MAFAGDPKLGIPKLDPMEIEKVVVGDSKSGKGLGISLSCHKCKIGGLRNVKLEDAKSVFFFLILKPTILILNVFSVLLVS